ncbi:hypothetical protein J2755_000983 [Methanohalophilus levihalophilus]|uniref:DUF5803 family protein n=1 Tax=Methanohalophilus levihalophilus TaxID=1431282 RepID=UPI001AE97D6E|nr:DUF5803 family protein [Methanohalophilus levihalophilus]MBP2030049.1 hypothetical protein [Methanohalophilus levihalophilus]
MDSKAFCIILVVLFSVLFASGCIDELVAVQEDGPVNVSVYEIVYNGKEANATTFNETTFFLTKDGFATGVYALDNASSIEIIPMEDLTNPGEDPISEIVIIAEDSGNVTDVEETLRQLSLREEATDLNFTIEEVVERGQKSQVIDFNKSITGFVAFKVNVPLGQDFIYMPTHDSVVRIVLPAGYTTGNPFIGKVQPEVNFTYHDENDRQVLGWIDLHREPSSLLPADLFNRSGVDSDESPVEYHPVILKFYTTSAPLGLLVGTTILSIATLIVALNYASTRRKLEEKRMEIENMDARKKD